MYNETTHWNQCTICGEKQNEINHSYTNSWIMGTADNCSESNKNIFTCICGYSYESTSGRKQHSNFITYHHESMFDYRYRCNTCANDIIIHECCKIDGSKITCKNLGTCYLCGYTYDKSNTFHYYTMIDKQNCDYKNIKCRNCQREFPLKIDKLEFRWEKVNQIIMSIDLTWNDRNYRYTR